MTTSKHIEAYPHAFKLAVERAQAKGSFEIPASQSAYNTLRMQMFGYIKALRLAGQSELANSIYITSMPGNTGIRLIHRDNSPAALDILKALGEQPQIPGDEGADFFDRIG